MKKVGKTLMLYYIAGGEVRGVKSTPPRTSVVVTLCQLDLKISPEFRKSMIPPDFTARELKTRENRHFYGNSLDWNGKSGFSREPLGWEWGIEVSSGTVWVGPRERYFHGNGIESQLL